VGQLTEDNAWLFLYCCVAWFEEIPRRSGNFYLHINDRLKSQAGRTLAKRVEQAIQKSLPAGVTLRDVVDQVGRAYDRERKDQGFEEWQRNNVTGNAFEAALQVLIARLAGQIPSRTPRLNTLAGFELAPQGYHSRPDLVMFSARDFRLLISTKWTLRKERLGTYLHEAYFYKKRRPDLQVAFVVAEFNLNILEWLCDDPLVDRVYHISRGELLAAHRPFQDYGESTYPVSLLLDVNDKRVRGYGRWLKIQSKLFDLSQLFEDIRTLRRLDRDSPVDPDGEEVDEEANSD